MPFTTYHFGPALLLGVLLFPFLDVTTLMVASVVLDLEPLAVLVLGLPIPLHGFFHTYLGATIVALVLSAIIWPFRAYLNQFISLFGLHQKSNSRHIILASLIGTNFHVFLDSFLYMEMNPFYPLLGNPFLSLLTSSLVYTSCVLVAILGLIVYLIRIFYSFQGSKDNQMGQNTSARID